MNLIKKGSVYHAAFKSADGKRRTVTTRQTDRAKAKAVVESSGIAEIEAAAQTSKLTSDVVGRLTTGKKVTLESAVKPFSEWLKSRGRSPKLIAEVCITLAAWMREMELASLPPSAVTSKHIASWVNDADKERGVGSRKVAIGHIHTFFSFLTASGWVASDPSKAVGIDYSVLSHEQKEPADRMPFTQDEIIRIVAHFKSELYDLSKEIESVKTNKAYTEKGREAMLEKLWAKHRDLFFWLFAVVCSSKTGLRLSDIASLQWRSFESGKLVVWMEKTNQRIEHDCPEEIETMATQIALTNATYMFPDQHAIITNVKRRSLLSITFTRIIQRLGIVGKSFHSLRHTYASQVHKSDSKEELIKKLADSLSLAEVKKLLGHASVETTRGYIHK